jgi:DNA replication protein DnaC
VVEAPVHYKRTESILDRIINAAHHIHMDGRSYRPNKRLRTTAAAR